MRKESSILTGILSKITFYLFLLLIWQLIYFLFVETLCIWKPYAFPSPSSVFNSILNLIKNKTLPIGILVSMKRILLGYSLSILFGSLIGLIMIISKSFGEHISSLILGLQTLPSICWLPFSILWFGLNEKAIIFVIVIGSTFAIAISIESGIKNVNPLYIKAGITMGARKSKLYRYIILPAALPNIITGLKQAWSFAWRALMAGEMLMATKGLGQILMWGRDLADISQVVAVMIIIIVLGLIVDKYVFSYIEEKILLKWGLLKNK